MAVGVAAGFHDGRLAFVVNAEEGLGGTGGDQGIHGGLRVAVGAVLETHRHREAGGHLPMGLAFGSAGANGGPGYEVGKVLRDDGIQEFGSRIEAGFGDFHQQAPGAVQAVLNLVGIVKVGVVNQAFPADGSARLFKINAHHHEHPVAELFNQRLEARGVIQGRRVVVYGTGADDNGKAVIIAVQDGLQLPAAFQDRGFSGGGQRDALLQFRGAYQGVVTGHVYVLGGGDGHGVVLLVRGRGSGG